MAEEKLTDAAVKDLANMMCEADTYLRRIMPIELMTGKQPRDVSICLIIAGAYGCLASVREGTEPEVLAAELASLIKEIVAIDVPPASFTARLRTELRRIAVTEH